MKIIINASNLRVGGAIQVTLSVINELYAFPEYDFYVFLSPAFNGLLEEKAFKQANIKFYWVDFPSRITFSGRVKQLDILEEKIGPNCVFSIFGPTYWSPKAPHMAGFAQGYYLYGELPYFKRLGALARLKLFLLSNYHRLLLQKHVQHYVVETEDVKFRLSKFLKVSLHHIHVATNTYSNHFCNFDDIQTPTQEKPFKLLTIAYPYPHKNLNILKKVSDILNEREISYQFQITVPDDYYKMFFNGYEETIINLGPVKNIDCPHLYANSDAMILPSLVECFSASYPESMKMKRPILTSDYSFAKSVCGNAAIYFNALDPIDISEKIIKLANDDKLYKSLVLAGTERLSFFMSPKERCDKYIDTLSKMSK